MSDFQEASALCRAAVLDWFGGSAVIGGVPVQAHEQVAPHVWEDLQGATLRLLRIDKASNPKPTRGAPVVWRGRNYAVDHVDEDANWWLVTLQ